MMRYLLLTGATGLLGDYLLRDFLRTGTLLAVVVRKSLVESAISRIESNLARWERKIGYPLPRPVVLEGDITKPELGLPESDVQWIADHCDRILHNAASLSFVRTASGEPERSNVEGTRHVLDVCEKAGLREFFHVSTAYVSGLREGTVREDELQAGQQPANVYEASKILGEELVRDASFLDRVTVFRPGIIVGDSLTGYTTTFHGFYAPLKIIHALAPKAAEPVPGAELMKFLGFSGSERKHFIPVDWVSQAIRRVVDSPIDHGKTYHLTPDEPVDVSTATTAMTECLAESHLNRSPSSQQQDLPSAELKNNFMQQLQAYQSYWRDDPRFDKTNVHQALPDLPNPKVDLTLLKRMCRFAIRANFGWPRPQPIVPKKDFSKEFRGSFQVQELSEVDPSVVGLQVNGPGGGQWRLQAEANQLVVRRGLPEHPDALVYMNTETLGTLWDDPESLQLALQTGRLLIEGKSPHLRNAAMILQQLAYAANRETAAV